MHTKFLCFDNLKGRDVYTFTLSYFFWVFIRLYVYIDPMCVYDYDSSNVGLWIYTGCFATLCHNVRRLFPGRGVGIIGPRDHGNLTPIYYHVEG
jgi:hypothetical protein